MKTLITVAVFVLAAKITAVIAIEKPSVKERIILLVVVTITCMNIPSSGARVVLPYLAKSLLILFSAERHPLQRKSIKNQSRNKRDNDTESILKE